MGELDIQVKDLVSLKDWEEWSRNKTTVEFFDTMRARITVIRDELEQEVDMEKLRYKQGEINSLRFLLALPEVVISDLNSKEKEDVRRNETAGVG